MAKVDWLQMTVRQVYALARALHTLYPLATSWNNLSIKLYDISLVTSEEQKFIDTRQQDLPPGSVEYSKQFHRIYIKCADGWISCAKIGLPAKKPMNANDFNNGYVKKEAVDNRLFK